MALLSPQLPTGPYYGILAEFATPADLNSHSPDIDSHVTVVNGASVKKGQFLGNVGNSGATAQYSSISHSAKSAVNSAGGCGVSVQPPHPPV